jgi:hypothetical protein
VEKIIITEEQEKTLKGYTYPNPDKVSLLISLHSVLDLDLVTLARIVEGEPYKVKCEFKVGDLVQRSRGNILEVVDGKNDPYKQTTLSIIEEIGAPLYKLICKAENREDLKGE